MKGKKMLIQYKIDVKDKRLARYNNKTNPWVTIYVLDRNKSDNIFDILNLAEEEFRLRQRSIRIQRVESIIRYEFNKKK